MGMFTPRSRFAHTGGLAIAATAFAALVAAPAPAQRPTLGRAVRQFVAVDTSVVALTHVRVIDGTGAPARDDQTLVIRDGNIAALGAASSVSIPAGAEVMDLSGKSVIPGLVMLHEHLFYPTGPGVYGNDYVSFTRLYLAGGVTTMRTGGNVGGYADLRTATAFKMYMNITRPEMAAAIDAAHKRGLKVTGHLCSVTYREAADLGIDDLEHGFFVSTDFVKNKQPDLCPGQNV